jgi:hypothetical protein
VYPPPAAKGGGKGGGKGDGKGGGDGDGKGGRGGGGRPNEVSNFDFAQIDMVVATVREVARKAAREATAAQGGGSGGGSASGRILLVLHTNHTDRQRLSDSDAAILARWRSEGLLYTTPMGMNDDWYWLHAAVVSGEGCRVVSNDQMRDHHFGLLHTSAFARWKERHVRPFSIHSPPPDANADTPKEVRLLDPLPYSHRMQEHVGQDVWHVPVAGETPDAWLCVHRAKDGD